MSTDRELLEAAARTVGVDTSRWTDDNGGGLWIYPGVGARKWNPLTDDGDALRLAVKLGLEIHIDRSARRGTKQTAVTYDGWMDWAREPHGSDAYAATRRAIVRAAAELGRAVVAETGEEK